MFSACWGGYFGGSGAWRGVERVMSGLVVVCRARRGVRGRGGAVIAWSRRLSTGLGDERDALIGAGERVGGGPVVKDPHDVLTSAAHDAGGCVPELPTQHFGFRDGEWPVEAVELEPAHEIGGERDDREASTVGVEIDEREPFQTRVFQTFDVVFDVGVRAHVDIEGDRVAGLVGVVTPVAELERWEQRCLRAGMQRFAPHDQSCP